MNINGGFLTMGTKRVGLARMEALMENLKREIVGFNVESTVASVTTITADGALARNSINLMNDTASSTYTLPAASTCSRGDIIIVKYIAAIANSEVHKFGTSGEFFAAQSTIFKADGGKHHTMLYVAAPNGSSNDFLNLTGATHGGPGIGTELRFHFNGSGWAVDGKVLSGGNGSVAPTVAFADT